MFTTPSQVSHCRPGSPFDPLFSPPLPLRSPPRCCPLQTGGPAASASGQSTQAGPRAPDSRGGHAVGHASAHPEGAPKHPPGETLIPKMGGRKPGARIVYAACLFVSTVTGTPVLREHTRALHGNREAGPSQTQGTRGEDGGAAGGPECVPRGIQAKPPQELQQ